jgi:exodeoxyribonuclease VII small subunit
MSPPRKTSRPSDSESKEVLHAEDHLSEQEREWRADVAQLSFQEARTALELSLAQLQAADLEVEAMAGHYRRALTYLERCEAVLAQVEQEVIEWDQNSPAPNRIQP